MAPQDASEFELAPFPYLRADFADDSAVVAISRGRDIEIWNWMQDAIIVKLTHVPLELALCHLEFSRDGDFLLLCLLQARS